MQQDYASTISRNAGVPFMEYICGQHDDLEYGQSLYTAWEFAGIQGTDRDYLWGSHGVQMVSSHAQTVYDHHRLFAQDADPGHAPRLGPTQPSGPGSPVIQPDIGAGYHHNRQDTLSYTCPQVTLTLSPVPSIFPAAANKWSYWVRPYSDCYATMSSPPTVRPPRPLCCLLWLFSYLSRFWSTPNTHSQVWLSGYLIHPWSTPTTPSHPSASCGYLTYPWRMPTMHALLPAVTTWLLITPWSTHTTPSQVWLCGYLTHPWSTPTTPTSLPLSAVATWLSHPSLEYAHHAQPGVAISPIPGVRPPLCQLWLRGYLVYPWSTHTTPSQVWLCGYLTRPWSTPLSASASCGYITYPWSTPTTPTSLSLPAVATWLSHPSLEYAHHAHLSASASCGYVTISLIRGVRTPRPARCGYVAISSIPEVRLSHLSPIMPTTPTLLPAVATWLLINPWSTHITPSQVCLSHISLEYAHHTHPLPAVATWLEHTQHARSSTSSGYVAMSPIPGVRPTHLAICQVWLCGNLPHPLSTPATPTLCQRRLRSYLIYPWSTPILLPAAATRLRTWPWNTPTTPSQLQVWWLCGHLTFHQVGFSC